MRKLLFIGCLAIIAAGCKKESQTPNNRPGSSMLFARWELRSRTGGWQPTVSFAPGSGNLVQFNADSTYAFYTGGTVLKQGTFHIVEKIFTVSPEKVNLIYYDHANSGEVMILKSDTLIIGSSAADGIESLYIKK